MGKRGTAVDTKLKWRDTGFLILGPWVRIPPGTPATANRLIPLLFPIGFPLRGACPCHTGRAKIGDAVHASETVRVVSPHPGPGRPRALHRRAFRPIAQTEGALQNGAKPARPSALDRRACRPGAAQPWLPLRHQDPCCGALCSVAAKPEGQSRGGGKAAVGTKPMGAKQVRVSAIMTGKTSVQGDGPMVTKATRGGMGGLRSGWGVVRVAPRRHPAKTAAFPWHLGTWHLGKSRALPRRVPAFRKIDENRSATWHHHVGPGWP